MKFAIGEKTVCLGDHSQSAALQALGAILPSSETALRMAEFFKTLSDPTRLRIISVLAQAELCVGDLCRLLGMAQPAISQQLRLLRQARLVSMRREGKHVFYALSDDHICVVFQQGLDHVQEQGATKWNTRFVLIIRTGTLSIADIFASFMATT